MTVKVTRAVKKVVEDLHELDLCLNCHDILGDLKQTRGIHAKCYSAQRRAIDKGEYTDDDCVAGGWILPPKLGRPPTNPATLRAKQK